MDTFSDHSDQSTVPMSGIVYPSWPELPPDMEDFQLCNSLGSGATGTVYRTVQTKEYAVKVIPWNPANLRESARREYEVAKLFSDYETIVHTIAWYEYNSSSFILQEMGEPIIDYFFRHPCSLRFLLQALLDVSDSLACIHSKGYIHFDVKPGNILMIKGKARLGDFSHCRRFVPGQEYEGPIGTSVFMAPEIMSGAEHSGLEDMYSLGITMYALLMAGSLPSENQKVITSLFIHPELLSIIRRAAAPDTNDRYPDFEAFSEDIRFFMAAHYDELDEVVPTYQSTDLRRPTLPQFFDSQTESK